MSNFMEIEVRYKALRERYERGDLTQEEFLQQVAQGMSQDETGRWWTIHPENGMWHYRWKDEWRPGVPPGHMPHVIKQVKGRPVSSTRSSKPARSVQSPPEKEPERTGFPRWLIPVVMALGLVVVVVAVVFWFLFQSPRGGDQELLEDEGTETPVMTETKEKPLLVATFTPAAAPSLTSEASLATATSTPELTAVATMTRWPEGPDAADFRPEWPQEMEDDFSLVASGWSRGIGDGILVDYRDGRLMIELQGADRSAWSRYELVSFINGWAEATVVEMDSSPSGSNSSAGIALHVTEDTFAYLFRIDSAGRYAIDPTLSGADPFLVDWTFSDHIQRGGEPNRLAVLARNDRYFFFINGWLVGPEEGLKDESYPVGVLSLWGENGDGDRARIVFDDALLLVGPDVLSDEFSPTVEPEIILTPTSTIASSIALTPTIDTEAGSIPTATVTLEPLSFEMSYDSWYPGSGDKWIIRFFIQARGGDGQYTFTVADQTFTTDVFDLEWGCGFSLTTDVVVEAGDGQRAVKTQWIAHVPCTTP